MDSEEGLRDIEAWHGLTVRTLEGHVIGRVVGVFAEGPLAGRLRVQGAYVLADHKTEPLVGTAVYAIPRAAVVRRRCPSSKRPARPPATAAPAVCCARRACPPGRFAVCSARAAAKKMNGSSVTITRRSGITSASMSAKPAAST